MRIWRPGQLPKSVKLQKPARATVCSHSVRDATASVEPILNKYLPVKWSKVQASWTLWMLALDGESRKRAHLLTRDHPRVTRLRSGNSSPISSIISTE